MSLELYLGPMFAGKSSAILGMIRRNEVIGRRTLCLTSALDTRYTTEAHIVSHNNERYPAVAVGILMPILDSQLFRDAESVIIEEAQFFPDLRNFVLEAVERHGKDVLCVGLDGDSERRPFGQLLDLIPYADKIQKFTALCTRCKDGTEAIFTYRKVGAPTSQVAVGGKDTYEPLCRHHYLEGQHDNHITEFIAQQTAENLKAHPLQVLERCISTFGMKEGRDFYEQLLNQHGVAPSLR